MNSDITKCNGESCVHKESCWRYLATPKQIQSYFDISPVNNNVCEYYIEYYTDEVLVEIEADAQINLNKQYEEYE